MRQGTSLNWLSDRTGWLARSVAIVVGSAWIMSACGSDDEAPPMGTAGAGGADASADSAAGGSAGASGQAGAAGTSGSAGSSGSAGGDGGTAEQVDVVIVGAGSGGVSAAIAAARLGASVLLIEATDWIGGQSTAAGVSTMDGANQPPGNSGLYRSFQQRIRDYYSDTTRFPPNGKSIGTCYWNTTTTCFEPGVGQQILLEMLQEYPSIDLALQTQVTSVDSSGNQVTGVRLSDGRQIESQVLVDSTEYGDVVPLTPARYRVGNSESDAIDPSSCIQQLTYKAIVKRYPQGVPPELVVDTPLDDYPSHRQHFVSIVTSNGNALQRPIVYPVNWDVHVVYRGMPDSSNPTDYTSSQPALISRTGINWANDWPRTRLSVDYLEDLNVRAQTDCEAKIFTINFLHYMQTDLGKADWSVANDEGYDTAYNTTSNLCDDIPAKYKELEKLLPVMPYVRESRRIVAEKTLTAAEIRRSGTPPISVTNFKSAVAVGDYPTDLHGCRDDADLEGHLGENASHNSGSGPFNVPFESLIPEVVDGLLAAEKNIGVTRLAAGAIRLQPITMLTGEAVGTMAAMAVDRNVALRNLSPIAVQAELVSREHAVSRLVFDDVPMGHERWPDVQLTSVHEIMIGVGGTTFGINQALTRAQTAVVFSRLFALDTATPPATPTFQDVPTNHPAYAFVEAFAAAGYTSGCATSPPQYCPDNDATRGQVAAFLQRGMSLPAGTGTALFSDVPTSHAFFGAVQAVADVGLMEGCATSPARFCPDAATTRGDMAFSVAGVLTYE